MTIIRLQGLDFFAHHGYYPEERKIGNKFTVDVSLGITLPKSAGDVGLDSTVNYEQVYSTVKKLMSKTTELLETIANRINHELIEQHIQIEWVETAVHKHNPPIDGVCEKATVVIRTER